MYQAKSVNKQINPLFISILKLTSNESNNEETFDPKKCTVMCYHQKLFYKECILTSLPPRNFAILIAHIAQRELKIAQIAQVNQPLQLLSSNCIYGHGDGLSNTVNRKKCNWGHQQIFAQREELKREIQYSRVQEIIKFFRQL